MKRQGFTPLYQGTTTHAVTNSSSREELTDSKAQYVLVTNGGNSTAFLELGGETIAAATDSGTPILEGESLLITRSFSAHTHIAAICGGSDTTTLYYTLGYC